jgi:hypothetical protein
LYDLAESFAIGMEIWFYYLATVLTGGSVFIDYKFCLKNSTEKLGKSIKLPKITDAGTQIKYKASSKSKKICQVRNNAVNGLKAGNCIVKATAPATMNKDAFTRSLLIQIKR